MKIEKVESKYLKSNMYALIEDRHIIMIDPHENYILDMDCILDYIILTHEHCDHISGVNKWKERTNAKIVCSTACGEGIKSPKKNLSQYFDVFQEMQNWINIEEKIEMIPYMCKADLIFENEIEISWQNHLIKVFETPGHSKGSECILVDNEILFSGDSLMRDYSISCGLPGGSKKDWAKTSSILRKLSKNIKVMPGHFEEFYLEEYGFWDIGT